MALLDEQASGVHVISAPPFTDTGAPDRLSIDRWPSPDRLDAYLPDIRREQQPDIGLAVRKETLQQSAIIASASARAPGPSLDAADYAESTRILTRGLQPTAAARRR